MTNYMRFAILLIVASLVLSGCNFSLREPPKKEEVTLNFFYGTYSTGLHDTKDLAARLNRKFPHVTFRHYLVLPNSSNGYVDGGLSYRELLEKGISPDLMLESVDLVPHFVQEGLLFDQTNGIRSANINLDKFQPELLDHIRAWAGDGSLYALPYRQRLHALFYDKDEIKKHDVTLSDGMTWEEIIQMPQVGIQNKTSMGEYAIWSAIENQLDLRYINPDTNEPDVRNESWEQSFHLWKQLDLNAPDDSDLLLYPATFEPIKSIFPNGNWDVVSFPRLASNTDLGPNGLADVIAVSPLSRHKQVAFEVMAYMVSDEFQLENARLGDPSVLTNKEVQEQFGADSVYYKEKNVRAFFDLPNRKINSKISVRDKSYRSLPVGVGGFGSVVYPVVLTVLRNLSNGSIEHDEAIQTIENRVQLYVDAIEEAMRLAEEQMQLEKARMGSFDE